MGKQPFNGREGFAAEQYVDLTHIRRGLLPLQRPHTWVFWIFMCIWGECIT